MKADAAVMLAAMKADPRVPNIDATAGGGQAGAGKPRSKKTPEQLALMAQYNMTEDEWDANLARIEG
jgi:hypothetical protein